MFEYLAILGSSAISSKTIRIVFLFMFFYCIQLFYVVFQ